MNKKVAILQSNYIPWKGYFDIVNMVDEFIIFDEMQYTRRDWRNRNKIKTREGLKWLTIPVNVKGKYHQKIIDTTISEPDWADKHWKTMKPQYAKAAFFGEYDSLFENLYLRSAEFSFLSEVNYLFIDAICEVLGITTKISWDHDYTLHDGKSERLLDLTLQAGGDVYLSGPAAKGYLDEQIFADAGVQVEWMDYSDYPIYEQLHGKFEHGVSILDLIFNQGPESTSYMKSFEQ